MTNYSLIKIGNDYVVRVDDQCVMKFASRRRAALLISEAVGLLNAVAPTPPQAETVPSPSRQRETPEVP